ncbi:hypothetical protein P7K49_031286, partial [Saguinus oedipus]
MQRRCQGGREGSRALSCPAPKGGVLFHRVAAQAVGEGGGEAGCLHRAEASSQSGCCCPTGLPTSNTRHNPARSEKKDPSSAQLSDMPTESQMEELTT